MPEISFYSFISYLVYYVAGLLAFLLFYKGHSKHLKEVIHSITLNTKNILFKFLFWFNFMIICITVYGTLNLIIGKKRLIRELLALDKSQFFFPGHLYLFIISSSFFILLSFLVLFIKFKDEIYVYFSWIGLFLSMLAMFSRTELLNVMLLLFFFI